jgi:hypothetical protein
MRKLLLLIPLAGILLVVIYQLLAGGDAGRELLAKAVEAHGGEARYEKSRTGVAKGIGKESRAHDLPFSWEENFQLPGRLKSSIRKDFGGPTTLTHLYADGKHRIFQDKKEVNVTSLEEEGENIESMPDILGRLVLAMRRKTTITPVEDIMVRSRPAAGIEIDAGDQRKLRLYFDKQTHFLVKMTKEKKDPHAGSVEVELFCTDYKDVDGIAVPGKIAIYQDGKMQVEMTVIDVKFLKSLDDSVFAGP